VRILLVSEIPLFPTTGGVQRHVLNLARYQERQGHEVDILTSRDTGDLPKEADLEGVRVLKEIRPLGYKQFSWIYNSYNVMKQINHYGRKYDIIHYHGGAHYFFKNLAMNRPLISTLHGIYPVCLRESFLFDRCLSPTPIKCALCFTLNNRRSAIFLPQIVAFCAFHQKFIKSGLRSEQKIICVSDYVRKSVSRIIPLHNLVTIYPFLDFHADIEPYLEYARTSYVRKSYGLPQQSQIIVYFGRLSYEKGVDVLLDAFQKAQKMLGKETYLFIGGSGPQKEKIAELAREIPNTRILGFLSRREQIALMYQSDIFVSASRFAEALGMAVTEAASLGLPVIATRVGGSPEIVLDGKTGLLVEPQNSHALAEGLVKLLLEKELRVKYKENALQRAKMFDINIIGPKISDLYDTVLARY